jgi:hypothetical protein
MSSYVNGLLMAVLRPALATSGLDPDDQVGTKLPADYATYLPFVQARSTPGGSTSGPARQRTRFQVPIQIDIYATSARSAHAIGDACLDALEGAWSTQAAFADGHLAAVANLSGPTEFPEPDRADGIARFLITATLTVRPPAATP